MKQEQMQLFRQITCSRNNSPRQANRKAITPRTQYAIR